MNTDDAAGIPYMTTRAKLRSLALMLVWAGLVWNLLELIVALWSGVRAGSVALLGFGLDSFIEIFVGIVLVRHLSREWKGESEESEAENRVLRLIGVTFFVLSAYIFIHALVTLAGWVERPSESLIGIGLAITSAVVMTILYFWKVGIARRIASPALRAEAVESLVCDLQDLTLLVGLGLNALIGWWWADPVAALFLIPWLIKEGREAFSGDHDEHHGHTD